MSEVTKKELSSQVVRVPTPLYHNWLELTAMFIKNDGLSQEEAQKRVYKFLRTWILANYPLHKLCAFEEIDSITAKKIGKEQGMYVLLREMSKEEYNLAQEMNKKDLLGKDGNPQWTLELSYIPDLQLPSSSKAIPDVDKD